MSCVCRRKLFSPNIWINFTLCCTNLVSRTVKGMRLLHIYKVASLTSQDNTDTDRRQETPGSNTKDSLPLRVVVVASV